LSSTLQSSVTDDTKLATMRSVKSCFILLCLPIAIAHYSGSCAGDEVAGEVQGETGVICAPKCTATTYECSTDVPSGTTAQPQCMLQNVDNQFFCGLLCEVDNQCPSGAACRKAGTQQLGICIHPLSFSDWAKQSSRTKLGIGFPTGTASSKNYQIAKAFAALESLKRRHSIADGDADVLVVKEMLEIISSKSGSGQVDLAGALAKFESILKKGYDDIKVKDMLHQQHSRGLGPGDFMRDAQNLGSNLGSGLSGLEKEASLMAWDVEHFETYGAATELLRTFIEIAIVYLVGGCIYKSQTMGARGIDMVPHIAFWRDYPDLISDGVKYAMQLVNDALGNSSMSFSKGSSRADTGGFAPIGSSSDRDTFANFEPSR